MKRVILLLIILVILSSCASFMKMADPCGYRYSIYKEMIDPKIGQEMDSVVADIKTMMNQPVLLKYYTVVDPNPSDWAWRADQPVFYPEGSATQAMSEKGTYDIFIFNRNLWEVDVSRGYQYLNVSREQREYISPQSQSLIGKVMLFERIQLTFRDKKFVHWCFQMIR